MPRRRNPYRKLLAGLVALIVGSATLYVLGAAWWQASQVDWLEPRDLILPRLVEVNAIFWLAFVGASVGSFLNVVAWRMPQGRSVLGRSFCPRCRAQLRARDNLPVFGWLAIGGRCRTCRLPVSPRYPIVEALVAITFAPVGFAALFCESLPFQGELIWRSPLAAPLVDDYRILTVTFHLVGLSIAWAYALIRYDRHAIPGRLLAFGLAALTLPMLVFPHLMTVPWQRGVAEDWTAFDFAGEGRTLDAVLRLITALAAAVFAARVLARGLCPTADPKLDPLGKGTARLVDLIAVIAVPAVLIGWQALSAVLVMAGLFAAAFGRLAAVRTDTLGRFAVGIPFATAIQLVFWRSLESFPYWPGVGSPPWVILLGAALVLLMPAWLHEPAASHTRRDPVSTSDDAEEVDREESEDDEAEDDDVDAEDNDLDADVDRPRITPD